MEFLKNNLLLPVVLVLAVLAFAIHKYNWSVLDFVADRVVQRLDLNYSPYGPNNHPVNETNQPLTEN